MTAMAPGGNGQGHDHGRGHGGSGDGRGGDGHGGGRLRLVLATANPDKAAEIVAIVAAAAADRVELVARPGTVVEVEETGDTLEENARLKAYALLEATGLPAVADDTGLEVDALDGAPGVYSSRFAGEHASYDDNVAKLLADLEAAGAHGPEARRARFRTVAMACFPGGREVVANGVVEGSIAEARRGGEGFGYDPVFVPDGGDGRTFAEMTAPEKNARSHRARAFRALAVGLVSA
ncbi:MAG TPA: RdgB/HAM1 family non-canonical purine NTP pyrophosphatase [Acidimicrobiales bacterium]|nr:RdgB/HAM1 family non-canonical purine NTP pyrophosphatase [Acidimicrobiales bacterium]